MAEKKLKINISFPQYDKHIYDYIKAQPNPSAFVRKLVEAHMNGTLGNVFLSNSNVAIPTIDKINQTQEEVSVDEEETIEKNNEVKTGQFTPDYKDVKDLDAIDDLPF